MCGLQNRSDAKRKALVLAIVRLFLRILVYIVLVR